MPNNPMKYLTSWRWLRRLVLLVPIIVLVTISFSFVVLGAPVEQATAGLGVGRGDGTEIGINLKAFNALKADIAAGIYDRQCTAAEHPATQWHTLVNIQAKCHYDHMHGDDPNYVNDIFGEPGAWFGAPGQSISYPWQTFKAATANEPNTQYVANKQMENDLKHEGYLWFVRRDQRCPDGECITDFRLQTHAIFGAHDMGVRYHSFSLEARLCRNGNDPSTCGIIRYGGWVDTGRLFTTAPNNISCAHSVSEIFIPLPADTQYFPIERPESRDEIRCHPNITNLPNYPSSKPLAEWWAHGGGETRFQIRSYDPIGNVDPADPSHWQFYCAQNDVNCRYDASIFSAFIGYTLHIHEFAGPNGGPRLDSNGDGRTDYRGYMNRWGRPSAGCSSAGLDCIPYYYDNVPLNFANNKEARYFHTVCENCTRVDHDISKPGQKWITWFYRYAAQPHTPTPPPVTPMPPTATPETPMPPTETPETPMPPTETPETPAPPTTPPPTDPSAPTLRVDLSNASANVGEKIEASLNLFNVTNLYGLQTTCTVDPNVLVGAGRVDGDGFNSGNSFFVDNGFKADSGQWLVAVSRLQPNTPISGNATAFKLSYTVQAAGASPVNCTVLGVDANGREVALQVVNGQFTGNGTTNPTVEPPTVTPEVPTETPEPPTVTPEVPTETPEQPVETPPPNGMSVISGVIQYQNRPDNSGIRIGLMRADGTVLVDIMSNASGAFNFTDVPVGEYVVGATAPGHLIIMKTVSIQADGQTVDLGTLTLPAGDTDDNGKIDISDAGFVGANFGVSAPPAPAEADLNMDSIVNVSDLAMIGSNFGKTEPVQLP